MNTLRAKDGYFLYNGNAFVKEVATYGDVSMWREVNEAEKARLEVTMTDSTEITAEDETKALLTYANEVTGANDDTLSDAVRTLTDGYTHV